MAEILCFMPTYSPDSEASPDFPRQYTRLTNELIAKRINALGSNSRTKPWVYMDVIDSVLNVRPDMDLVVADGRSTDSIRAELTKHQGASGKYDLALYPEKESQWKLFNDVITRHSTHQTKYVVYTSSDIIWTMDWLDEAIREFDRDPNLMIVFPCVSSGDNESLPAQVAIGPRDMDMIEAPYQDAARAPVLNAYAMIFRIDFLKAYGGYPTIFRNCFTESFLHYMCEAIGGKMRLMPRGYCYHHNGIDMWVGEGGYYHYSAEKKKFDLIMDGLDTARSQNRLTKEFLREMLYV